MEKAFRLILQIHAVDGTDSLWVFQYGRAVVGSKKLRGLLAKAINEAHNFIDEEIDKKEKPKTLKDVKY